MYNTRRRSELLDSLDFLIPPVKKLPRAVYKDFLYNDVKFSDQDRLLRDCHRTALIANPFWPKTSESVVQTCSSLIFKKTTKQLIHEQYSILNLSTCNRGPESYIQNKTKQRKEDKPIIKVTVIPKTQETQTYSVFNNRCRHSKKVQCTVSNQDNSIKNQNLCFLTKCRKREKIHELKISESAKLSNRNICHKYGDISIKQITESRQIINSLNMDKRKRKDNKNKKAVKKNISDDQEPSKDGYGNNFLSPNNRKSRVTVVGQIGLTPDDRYVLKCTAALNDKPIDTNFIDDDANPIRFMKNYNFHHGSSQYRPGCCINNCETNRQFRQQDSNVQTDNPYNYNEPLGTTQNNRRASQSTQVNLNFPNTQSIKKIRNQTAQCYCDRATTANNLDTEAGDKVLKDCKSPLVIISVYPRQEEGTDANNTVKIIQRQTSPERKEITSSIRNNVTQQNLKKISPGKLYTVNQKEAKLPRSRSPSPKTKIESKNKNENKTYSKGKINNSLKKGGPSQIRSPKSYIINSLEDRTSCHCTDSTFLQTEQFSRPPIKTNTPRGTEEVKKALVNSFLRNVNVMDKDNRRTKLFQPKDDASKVTINIDGENDQYNIFLEHSPYDTGVAVKKTTKARPYQNFTSEEEMNTKSLENFLFIPNDRRRKGMHESNQETERTQPPDVLNIKSTTSRLNIKDSIEIFRRQGEHSSYLLKPHLQNDNNHFADTVFNSDCYAPVKHYRGDDCSLSDPNERDREIRELLGIMRCHRLQNTEHKDGRVNPDVTCCCRENKSKSAEVHEGTQIDPYDAKATTEEVSQPNQEHQQKANISRRSKITQKSEHKRVSEHPEHKRVSEHPEHKRVSEHPEHKSVSEHPEHKRVSEHQELKASEEDTSGTPEQPMEDFSKYPNIHRKSANDTHVQSTSNISRNNNISQKDKRIPTVHIKDSIMPQNIVLNRNIQIFLQVEQFNKQKPVVLNRKQYDKVKRVIECTISKKISIEKRKRCNFKNCNVVSIGEIKVKPRLQQPLRVNREIQTDRSEIKNTADAITHKYKINNSWAHDNRHEINKKIDKQIATDVIVTEQRDTEQVNPRHTVSSMEIRYASVEYNKRVIISSSSTHFKNDIVHSLHTSNAERNSNSIHTIFKGHKRSATPNLGTSAYSLYSNLTDIAEKSYKEPQCAGDFKPKKPFLQRLISCLIMRSTQTSRIKAVQKRKLPSINNSLDSYHISTSLGALEMTSSLYDTSASFYSNHTTMPINKIKRGFFSSVRGFLTSRRS